MPVPRVLILGDPRLPQLRLLDELPQPTDLHIGNDAAFVAREAPLADAVLNASFDGSLFSPMWPLAKRARWVHSLSAGVEGMLTPEFVASPVPLTNARGVFAEALGEYAITAVLHFAKNVPLMTRNQQAHRWEWQTVEMVRGKTFGVIGYGGIGRESARLAAAIGMRVIALRRRASLSENDGIAERIYTPDQLHELLAASDYVLMAMPSTPETRHMIGAAELRAMKDSAILINLGRGSSVDEAALVEALREKRIRGAALDVVEKEPLAPEDPLYTLDNVLISSHSADRTPDFLERATRMFMENYGRFVRGQPLLNVVDKKAGY
jgi:phosphoglycerate dehydrogenase-like enzyme